MDWETRSELGMISRENSDKARLKKEEMRNKVNELKVKLENLEKEIRQLDNMITEAVVTEAVN